MRESARKGFVTVATGNTMYYIMARNLLLSYRHFATDPLPFAIICDRTNRYTDCFDDVILLRDPTRSYNDKLLLPSLVPYDQTIFVDADCLAYRDLNDMWKIFEGAPAFGVLGRQLPLDSENGWFKKSDIGDLSDKIKFCITLHGGAYYIDRNGAGLSDFIGTVAYVHEHFFDYKFRLFIKPADEPIFALACAVLGYAPADNYFPWICYMPLVQFEKLSIKRGELAYQHLNINNLETRTGYLLHWGHRKFRWLFWKQSYDLLLITKGTKTAVMDSFRLAFLFCKKITINFFKRNYKKIVAG